MKSRKITGEDIRKIRGKMTQPQFCAKIGLENVSTLSRWERGVNSPSSIWLDRILTFKKKGKI